MAWLAASRTRGSAHGDLGSHCSGSSSQKAPLTSGAASRKPGRLADLVGRRPGSRYAMSTSPARSAAARVVSSGIERMTRRFTDGALRQ